MAAPLPLVGQRQGGEGGGHWRREGAKEGRRATTGWWLGGKGGMAGLNIRCFRIYMEVASRPLS
jgi:hypothetical protein